MKIGQQAADGSEAVSRDNHQLGGEMQMVQVEFITIAEKGFNTLP